MQEEALPLRSISTEQVSTLRLEEFPPYRLSVCSSLISAALSQVYTKRYKIGGPEWRVLITLGQFRALTARDVGNYSHMHKTKVSRAVTGLQRRGWVTRNVNSRDRRETILELTPLGKDVCSELAPLALKFTRELWDVLDDQERLILDRALRKLSARAGEFTVGLPMTG